MGESRRGKRRRPPASLGSEETPCCSSSMSILDFDRPRSSSTSILDLPDSILMDIFSRLPLSTILDCKLVGKSWYFVILDPEFADLCAQKPTNIVLSAEHSALCLHEFTGYWRKPKIFRTLYGLSCGFLGILGSCNGLVCFSEFIHGHRDTEKELDARNLAQKLYVSNPLLGEYILLPQPRLLENVSRDWYGFGFCPKSRHYKVIRIFLREENLGKSEAEICTVGVDGNWRVLSLDAPVPSGAVARWNEKLIRNDICAVSLFGRVHWITDDNSMPGFIYSFVIGEEKLQRVPQPCEVQWNPRTRLGVLRDCLCVYQLCSLSNTLDIWWMMKYNEVESWTKQSFDGGYYLSAMGFRTYYPIVLLGTKEMVIASDYGSLISYNMEKGILTRLESAVIITEGCKGGHRCFSAVPYIPCFLSLKNILAGSLEGEQGNLDFVMDFKGSKNISRNNQRAADITTILDLPSFILEYIFLRIPEYIGSLRSVCKIWYNFISSPAFGHAFSTAQHLVLSENSTCSLLELNLDDDCGHKRFIQTTSQLYFKDPRVLGSANGLICFYTSFNSKKKGFCICNSLLRECFVLPDPSGPIHNVKDEVYGFGFSPAAGQYKILRVLTIKWMTRLKAHVWTVGSDDSWRNLGRIFVNPIPKDWSKKTNKARLCEATLNGALHWIAEYEKSYLIYSFDVSEERIHLIPPPPCAKSRYGTNLGVLRDSLCVFQLGCSMDLHIWKMERYGDGNSWNRESISVNSIPRGPRNHTALPVLTHKAGMLLMYADSGPLVSWCPKEKRFNIVKIEPNVDGCLTAIQYFPSFLSLRAAFKTANWCWRK